MYAGLTYYEQDGVEDLMIFATTKDLSALLEVCASVFELVIIMCFYFSMSRIITVKLREDKMSHFIKIHLITLS